MHTTFDVFQSKLLFLQQLDALVQLEFSDAC